MEKKSQKKLRVLCFHGMFTNKEILDYQLRQYKKYFKNVEFITFDGPKELDKSLLVEDQSLLALNNKFGSKCFAWFKLGEESNFKEVIKDTMKYILDFVKKEEPFDGVLGFSQGGAAATYFTYYCEFYADKIKDFQIPKFAILLCSASFYPTFSEKYIINTPSIHFIGENDFLFSKPLFTSTLFNKPIVIFHKEGHKIPKLREFEIGIMKDFFRKFEQNGKIHNSKL